MDIRIDDLAGPEIHALLEEHLRNMRAISPPESVHALDLDALRAPGITFWTVWSEGTLAGCGALKELDRGHGEVKSMRTASARRRNGVARAMLAHIVAQAHDRGYRRLSLETGSMDAFVPARRLYESFGFEYCGPFADYRCDPNSVFMSKALAPRRATLCPVCGGDNACAVAQSGRYDAACWCATAAIAPEALARVPASEVDRSCLCPRCAGTLPA